MTYPELIQAAYERRRPDLEKLGNQTNAYRLFGGRNERIPGLSIDVFDRVAVLNFYEGKCDLEENELKEIGETLGPICSIESAYLKTFVSSRADKSISEAMLSPEPLWGKVAAPSFSVLENGVRYEIHPYDGYSVGLFLDQRENRKRIAEVSSGKRLLNLFSYTCGFSVAAGLKGAQTFNVDSSQKYLDWGKRNFALNGMGLENHKFVTDDVGLYLKRLLKRHERFDTIVLDAPSFGRSSKGVFSIEKDLPALIENCSQLLNPAGYLLLSCNYQKWRAEDFQELLSIGLDEDFKIQTPQPLFDFAKEENPLLQMLVQVS